MANTKRKRKKKLNARGKLFLFAFCLIVIIIAALIISIANKENKNDESPNTILETVPVSETIPTEPPTPTPVPNQYEGISVFNNLYSNEAILIDAQTGEVIDELNADTCAFPASVTKMMTLLISCENLTDYDEVTPLPREIYDTLYYADLSTAGYECGEPITVNDLLYGLQLRSGAECCLGLANKIAGSEAAFVEMMNTRAQELGMTGTHFTNCTGLHNENHYSTVSDMAQLLQAGLKNEKFREVFSTSMYTSTPTTYHPGGMTIYSTFSQTLSSMDFEGGTFIGGKTGYTSEAGQCLASAATIDGHEFILVTFGAYDNNPNSSSHLHSADALNVYQALAEAL